MKQVKNYILFSAISLLTFTSCKKDNADIDLGTISVSIDGKQTTFNFGAKATTTSVTGGYGITIKGNKKDPAASQTNISFSITSPSPIVAKTYVENGGGNPLIQMEYFYDFILGIGTTASAYGSTTNPVTITITEITSSSARGTFHGELLYTALDGTTGKAVLSNGVFYVSF